MQLSGRVLTGRLMLMGWFGLLATVFSIAQSTTINQLKTRLSQPQSDSSRAQLTWALAQAYELVQLDSALYYCRQSIKVGQRKIDKSLLAEQYHLLGVIYFRQSDFVQSLRVLQQAQQIAQRYHLESILLKVQTMMAHNYHNLGDYALSLQFALQVLRSYERHPEWNDIGLGRIYTNLGIIYEDLHQHTQSLFYHRKRLELAQKRKDLTDVALALGNTAQFYLNRHDLVNAEACVMQSLSIAQQRGLLSLVSNSMEQLGSIAYDRHQYKKAIHYHQWSLHMNRRAGEQELVGYSYLLLAQDYEALTNYRPALNSANQAIAVLQKTRSPQFLQQTLAIKSQLLERMGNYHQALLVSQQAQLLEDSLTGLDKQKAIAYIQTQYDLERKQHQIQTLRQDLTIQKQAYHATELQLKLAHQQRLLFLTSSVLLILLLGLGYYSFRRQQKNSQLLVQQGEAMAHQAQQLTELNTTKDKLFSLIAHDMRSPLTRLKYEFHTLRSQITFTPSLLKPLNRLEYQVDTVLDLLTNLLDWSSTQLKGFVPHPERLDLADAVAESICLVTDHIRQKNITLFNHVPKETWVIVDNQQLQAVLRNVLGNAIKFTPLGGYIRLRSHVQDDSIELRIQDTGIGMTTQQLERLWKEPDIRPGTQGEQSTGLGLRLCQDILSQQAGSLEIISEPQVGTTVKLKLLAAEAVMQEK